MKRLLPLLLVTACSARPIAPPDLHLGVQSCDECAMAVSDARTAAAILVEDPDGTRRDLIFDDLGCLLAYERRHPGARPVARYVREYDGERWLALESATFLHSNSIATPMLYGTVAFASAEKAEAVRAERGGVVLGPEALR